MRIRVSVVVVSGTAGLEASWRFLEALAWLIGTLGGSCTVGRLLEALAHLLEGLGGIRKALRGTLEVLGRLLGRSWRLLHGREALGGSRTSLGGSGRYPEGSQRHSRGSWAALGWIVEPKTKDFEAI